MPPITPSLFREPTTITAHCDGGARGNPGPAGFGAQITDDHGQVLAELSEFLGIRTNNFAEYAGLLASLQYALDHGHRSLRVISDSELMVKQIQGKNKVNSPDLKQLWQEAKNRIAKLDRFEIAHALRHKNKDADRLANEAMDRGMKQGSRTQEARPYARPSSPQSSSSRPKSSQGEDAVERPPHLAPASAELPPTRPTPAEPTPSMLRGFARDGIIHILGPHTLPNGTFVKIIPE